MDAGNIIYIIAIIIYFIYTALKKGKGPEDIDEPSTPQDERPRRQTSFEDLLKEIREGQKERERDLEQSGQGETLEDQAQRQERKIERRTPEPVYEEKTYERPVANQPKAYQKFQGEVKSQDKPKLKTLDEQISLDAELEGLKASIEVEELEDKVKVNRYKSLLKNPETVKDAVVMSEILNRKHF